MTPEDVVQPGSLVHCKVIKVDKEKLHINLSLKVYLASRALLSTWLAVHHYLCNAVCDVVHVIAL